MQAFLPSALEGHLEFPTGTFRISSLYKKLRDQFKARAQTDLLTLGMTTFTFFLYFLVSGYT